MTEPRLDGQQQPAQLLALFVVQSDEQRILSLALRLGCPTEMLLAGSSQRYEVTPAIRRIALARDETVGLQWVEHRHQDARIGAHRLAQLRLPHRPAVVQQAEQVKLPRRQIMRRMGVAQPPHRNMPGQSQQQPGTRATLLQNSTLASE
jgi:hypothetical protein